MIMTKTKYRITSKSGHHVGIYEGETANEVLLTMFRDAGFGPDWVWINNDGRLEFVDEETERDCGGEDKWTVTEYVDTNATRLREIAEKIRDLADEAMHLVRTGGNLIAERRSRHYWFAQIRMAVDNDHTFLGTGTYTIMECADDLEGTFDN